MINYIEKGIGLHRAISAAGYVIYNEDGVWITNNDTAVQSIIDAYDQLPDEKVTKVAEVREEALNRIRLLFPDVVAVDSLYEAILLDLQPPADTDLIRAKNIMISLGSHRDNINAKTDVASVKGYNISDGWPA